MPGGLGLLMPEIRPSLEKIRRTGLADVFQCISCGRRGVVNIVDLLTLVVQVIRPCEAHARVHTLGGFAAPIEAARTLMDAMAALRKWQYRSRVTQMTTSSEPCKI